MPCSFILTFKHKRAQASKQLRLKVMHEEVCNFINRRVYDREVFIKIKKDGTYISSHYLLILYSSSRHEASYFLLRLAIAKRNNSNLFEMQVKKQFLLIIPI